MRRLGIVITKPKPPNHLEFYFMLEPSIETSVGTFIEVPTGRMVIFGKVTIIQAQNIYFENPEFVQSLLKEGLRVSERYMTQEKNYRYAKVKILGVVKDKTTLPPEAPPEPGEGVYSISKPILSYVFGNPEISLELGVLNRTDLVLSINLTPIMREHLLIAGSTGSGKTNTAAVIIRGILEKGFPVIVIDPHGEYEALLKEKKTRDQNKLKEEKIDVIKLIPNTKTNYKSEALPLSIEFSTLTPDQINEIAGISGAAEDLIHLAYSDVKRQNGENFSFEQFIEGVEKTGRKWKFHTNSILAAVRRLLTVKEFGILGNEVNLLEIVKPSTIVIVDLSIPLRERVRRTVAGYLIKSLFTLRQKKQLEVPVFVLIEEAHRFMPRGFTSYSGTAIQQVAREGRKFGVGIGIVTQMTRNLDPITIGQCNTKIILRLNNRTDLEVLIPQSDMIDTAETNLIPYMATGTAFITGIATKLPVMVKINDVTKITK